MLHPTGIPPPSGARIVHCVLKFRAGAARLLADLIAMGPQPPPPASASSPPPFMDPRNLARVQVGRPYR